MIKINLASRKQSQVSADGKGSKGPVGLGGMSLGQFRDLPIRKLAIPIVVAMVASYSLESYQEEMVENVNKSITKLKADEAKIQTGLSKVKSYESLKKSLDADELVIRTKLETVQKLMADRGYITKMLLSTASGIPKEVWLTGMKADKEAVQILGSSLGFNQISDFMKNLNDGRYFASIELLTSQQVKDGSETAAFELKAKRK